MKKYKTKIIAEIAWGHDGKIDQAIELLEQAVLVGADAISIHITDMEAYMVKHYGNGEGKVSAGRETEQVFDYLVRINLSKDDWINFTSKARERKIELCIMPNDLPSLEFSEVNLKPDYYVVPAACFVEDEFLVKVAEKKRQTIFRIGGATLAEIESAISIFRRCGNNNIILLHGFQNYPTALEETNLAQLSSLKEIFGCEIGLADHIDGSMDIAKVIPALSIPYGATYIEKHITLDRDKKSEDFESALNPKDFKQMVDYIRATEAAIGSSVVGELSSATKRYREISRKRIVAAKEINKGEMITKENTCFKRSDIGLQPDKLDNLLGRTAKNKINMDESILLENLK